MNTDTPHHSGSRVQSTSWVIDARWYYAFLGYALGVIIPDRTSTQYPIAILSVAFLLVLARVYKPQKKLIEIVFG